MKQCPQCGNTYTDDGLRYCLSDGAMLIESASGSRTTDATQVLRTDADQVRIDIPAAANIPPKHQTEQSGNSRLLWTTLGTLAAGAILLFVLAAAAGVAYYMLNSEGSRTTPNTPPEVKTEPSSPALSPSPAETALTEEERLRRELEELKKILEKQKSASDTNPDGKTFAKVNSPRDGFLALRSEPSIDNGQRLAKIPDNERIEIVNCDQNPATIGGKNGKWCLAVYGDNTGWVFDAFVEYESVKK